MKYMEVKKMSETAKGLKEFIEHKLPRLREEAKSPNKYGIDKHSDGFYKSTKCQSVNINELCYSSFSGSFGDSNTYSDIADLDTKILSEYFIKYLNIHKDEIMLEVANLIMEDAKKLKDIAIKEIDDYRASISKALED